jgi:hypothetical protein
MVTRNSVYEWLCRAGILLLALLSMAPPFYRGRQLQRSLVTDLYAQNSLETVEHSATFAEDMAFVQNGAWNNQRVLNWGATITDFDILFPTSGGGLPAVSDVRQRLDRLTLNPGLSDLMVVSDPTVSGGPFIMQGGQLRVASNASSVTLGSAPSAFLVNALPLPVFMPTIFIGAGTGIVFTIPGFTPVPIDLGGAIMAGFVIIPQWPILDLKDTNTNYQFTEFSSTATSMRTIKMVVSRQL